MKKLIALTILTLAICAQAQVELHGSLAGLSHGSSLANRPSCAVALRGLIWNVEVGGSNDDYQMICHRTSAGTYAWADF